MIGRQAAKLAAALTAQGWRVSTTVGRFVRLRRAGDGPLEHQQPVDLDDERAVLEEREPAA